MQTFNTSIKPTAKRVRLNKQMDHKLNGRAGLSA